MSRAGILWIVLVWIALWGDLAPGTLIAGVLIGVLITASTRAWLPGGPHARQRHPRPVRIAVLGLVFLRDLAVSSLAVARTVMGPTIRVRPAIISFPLRAADPLLTALVANGVTLTPGTLTVDVDPHHRWIDVHVLDLTDRAALQAELVALEDRAARALGITLPASPPVRLEER